LCSFDPTLGQTNGSKKKEDRMKFLKENTSARRDWTDSLDKGDGFPFKNHSCPLTEEHQTLHQVPGDDIRLLSIYTSCVSVG